MNWFKRLFGQSDADNGKGVMPALLAPAGSKRSADASPLVKHRVKNLIAQGTTVDGSLTTMDGAAVDGVVNGDITVRGANCAVLVRAGGIVNGDVRASIVVLAGEINGDIIADSVRLYAGSKHFGRVEATQLIVDRGASVNNENMSVGGGSADERRRPLRLSLVPQADAKG